MKALASLLSAYILLLGLLPCFCSDGHGEHKACRHETVGVQDHSHTADNGMDICSPFCLNHCCSHNNIVSCRPAKCSFQPFIPLKKTFICGSSRLYATGFEDAVWRPPVVG